MPREIFGMNPIQVAERMAATDDFAWNAFAYTYNNYARRGFAPKQLRFGNLLSLKPGGARLRGVLGGTGIAISTNCKQVPAALDYALFTADGHTSKNDLRSRRRPAIAPRGVGRHFRRRARRRIFQRHAPGAGGGLCPPALQRLCRIANRRRQRLAGTFARRRRPRRDAGKARQALPRVAEARRQGFSNQLTS